MDCSSLVTEELIEGPSAGSGGSSTSLLEFASEIWDRRAFVLKSAVVAGVLALAIALLLPKRYQSTTRLMPPDKNHGNLAALSKLLDQNIGPLALEAMGTQSSGALFVQVLRSRTVEDDLVQKFDLRHVYKKKLWRDARNELARNTDVSEDRKSGVISITVTANNPQLAASLARRYVEALNDLMTRLDTSAAHRERVFVEERLKQVKADLDRDSVLLSQFSSKTETLDPKEQGKTMVEAAAKLQGEMIAAEAELSGLRQIYGPENSRVRASEGKIAELKRELGRLQGNSSNEQTDYPSIRELPVVGLQYGDLYRNVRIQEVVFETLTKQFEMAKVEEARDLPSVGVLDDAEVPERKSGPKRTLIVLCGVLLGFALAASYIVLSTLWQNTSEEEPLKNFLVRLHHDIAQDAQRLPFVNSNVFAQTGSIRNDETQHEAQHVEIVTTHADAKRAGY